MATPLPPVFRKEFLDELLATELYLGRNDARRGRAFTQAVFDFSCDIVAAMPEAFPIYTHPLLPAVALRRAIFRREYALLYQIIDNAVVLVYFYHTRRDISTQAIAL